MPSFRPDLDDPTQPDTVDPERHFQEGSMLPQPADPDAKRHVAQPIPALDDGRVYQIPVPHLIEANHRAQFDLPYWQRYREFGDRFAASLSVSPDGTPNSNALIEAFHDVWSGYENGDFHRYPATNTLPTARRRLSLYGSIKKNGASALDPLHLIGRSSAHTLAIDGHPWGYGALDGNHRLMACHFCGVAHVPVLLVSTARNLPPEEPRPPE